MFYISKDLIIHNGDSTMWDVNRFAEKVKNTKVKQSESEADADKKLLDDFGHANFGYLTEPTTILDQQGRVMVWALPGVLHPKRLVRL
jgi:hypothetical protein